MNCDVTAWAEETRKNAGVARECLREIAAIARDVALSDDIEAISGMLASASSLLSVASRNAENAMERMKMSRSFSTNPDYRESVRNTIENARVACRAADVCNKLVALADSIHSPDGSPEVQTGMRIGQQMARADIASGRDERWVKADPDKMFILPRSMNREEVEQAASNAYRDTWAEWRDLGW